MLFVLWLAKCKIVVRELVARPHALPPTPHPPLQNWFVYRVSVLAASLDEMLTVTDPPNWTPVKSLDFKDRVTF